MKLIHKHYCSYFPDHLWGINLTDICKTHDLRYETESKSRWSADVELFDKVKKEGNVVLASLMFVGVRAFGWVFYGK